MAAQAAVQGGQLIAIGEQCAAIAIGAKWFRGKEADGRRHRLAAQFFAGKTGAESLRAIIEGEQIIVRGQFAQRWPRRWLAEQIDADHRARPQFPAPPDLLDAGFKMRRINLKCARIDIDKYRGCSQQQRHLGGRGIGKGGQKHRVAHANLLRHHRDLQRIRPGTDADAMRGAAIGGEALLQLADFRAENIMAMRQHRIDPRAQRRGNACLLCREIDKGNG